MSKSLFVLTKAITQLDELLDNNTDSNSQELIKITMGEVEVSFKEKAIQIAQYVKKLESDIEVAKGEKTRVEAFKKVQENKLESIREYLKINMIAANMPKIKTPTDSIIIVDGRDTLDVVDPDFIQDMFIKVEKTIMKKEAVDYWKETGVVPAGFAVKAGEPSIRISKPKVEGEENAPKRKGRQKVEEAKAEIEVQITVAAEAAEPKEDIIGAVDFKPIADEEFVPIIDSQRGDVFIEILALMQELEPKGDSMANLINYFFFKYFLNSDMNEVTVDMITEKMLEEALNDLTYKVNLKKSKPEELVLPENSQESFRIYMDLLNSLGVDDKTRFNMNKSIREVYKIEKNQTMTWQQWHEVIRDIHEYIAVSKKHIAEKESADKNK